MKKFTKKQRHEIYVYAKKIYEEHLRTVGICWCLHIAVKELYAYLIEYGDMREHFPEWFNKKPENNDDLHWFPRSDTESRIAIFNAIIEETKNETTKNKD